MYQEDMNNTSSNHRENIKQTSSQHRAGLENQRQCYVYVLSLSNNTYYTGMTIDIARRLKEHNEGKSKSTRNYLPFKLLYYVQMHSQKEARWLEKKIKNRGAARYLCMRKSAKSLRTIEQIVDMRYQTVIETFESPCK